MCLKASDLRIGNWIDIYLGRVQVTSKYLVLMEMDGGNIDAKPIPMTDGWLLRFGFKEIELIGYQLGSYNVLPTSRGFDFGFKYQDYNTPIDYVHQLQNLYFALTGSELEDLVKK